MAKPLLLLSGDSVEPDGDLAGAEGLAAAVRIHDLQTSGAAYAQDPGRYTAAFVRDILAVAAFVYLDVPADDDAFFAVSFHEGSLLGCFAKCGLSHFIDEIQRFCNDLTCKR